MDSRVGFWGPVPKKPLTVLVIFTKLIHKNRQLHVIILMTRVDTFFARPVKTFIPYYNRAPRPLELIFKPREA